MQRQAIIWTSDGTFFVTVTNNWMLISSLIEMIYNISTKFNAISYISWGTDSHWAHILLYNPISSIQIDALKNVWKSKKLLKITKCHR